LLDNNHNNLLIATERRIGNKYRSSGNDSNAGKVTVGLASHSPRVTDSVVYVPTGSLALETEMNTIPVGYRMIYLYCCICMNCTQGRHFHRGSRLVDFDITLGVAECVPLEPLTDNQVDCRPPTEKPSKDVDDTFCDGDTLSLRVSGRRF